jgi:hypothetical protein
VSDTHGLVTRHADSLDWAGFDPVFYEVKDATGRVAEPESGSVSALTCFTDTAAVEERPELAPVDADGEPATRERDALERSYVCPSVERYRAGVLEMVADAAETTGHVRLDDVGFPAAGYCRCERCEAAFEDSEHADREDWRAATVERFVADARQRVSGDLYVSLYPDPYPGGLRERTGLDPAAVSEYVDEFVVPLYDPTYATTYWLAVLARGFAELLATPFSVELYAGDVDIDGLVDAIGAVEEHADRVVFGYDAGNAQAAIRRRRAEDNDGATHRPD